MKVWSIFLPVQGFRGSFLHARRPRVVRAQFLYTIKQHTFGKVHRHTGSTGLKTLADVLFTLIYKVLYELLPGVSLYLTIERIEKVQHRGSNYGLLQGFRGILLGLVVVVGGVSLVAERPLDKTGELSMVSIIEDST
jgi:hypothetical protein